MQRSRRAKAALEGAGGDATLVARVAAALDALPDERRDAGRRLLSALDEVLTRPEQ